MRTPQEVSVLLDPEKAIADEIKRIMEDRLWPQRASDGKQWIIRIEPALRSVDDEVRRRLEPLLRGVGWKITGPHARVERTTWWVVVPTSDPDQDPVVTIRKPWWASILRALGIKAEA